jgi:hypothetical protein
MEDNNKNTEMSQSCKNAVSGSIDELLSKFDNGLELYRNNAVLHCIEHLVRGGDIYKILEQIIVMQANTQENSLNLFRVEF